MRNYVKVLHNIFKQHFIGYLLESPQTGHSNKYPKHMFYEEIRIKQGLSYITFCPLRIQQIHYNGNSFGNKLRGSCKMFCHWVRITSVLRFIKHIFITNLQSIPPLLKHIFVTFLPSREKQINSLLLVSVGDTDK